jgi:hypothetical protein
MVDLDSLLARAKTLGRTVSPPVPLSRGTEEERSDDSGGSREPKPPSPEPEGTMLVPIDAWNKMLNQLGNLHEAGQQLAEARERAAKAETEATFLRERLSEMRQASTPLSNGTGEQSAPPSSVPLSRGTGESASQGDKEDASDNASQEDEVGADSDTEASVETTTYWRYLTTGWRDRKRRSRR